MEYTTIRDGHGPKKIVVHGFSCLWLTMNLMNQMGNHIGSWLMLQFPVHDWRKGYLLLSMLLPPCFHCCCHHHCCSAGFPSRSWAYCLCTWVCFPADQVSQLGGGVCVPAHSQCPGSPAREAMLLPLLSPPPLLLKSGCMCRGWPCGSW